MYLSTKEFSRVLISSGSYGKVYRTHLYCKNFTIKSQLITSEDRAYLNSSIDEILREICFYKIASLLEIGPAYRQIFGFDILLFDDSIEFAMEMCEQNLKKVERMEKD